MNANPPSFGPTDHPMASGLQQRGIALLVGLFLGALTIPLLFPPHIRGDGVGYFAYLRSIVFDLDLDFRNEYLHYNEPYGTMQFINERPRTPQGYVDNVWSIGPGVLWAPFYLLVHTVVLGLQLLGIPLSADGYGPPYVTAIAVGSIGYGFGGLLLLYALIRSYYGTGVALLTAMVIWFATTLTFYMYFHPSLSHAPAFFAVALALFLWHRWREEASPWRWATLGIVNGVMIMQRWQTAPFLLLPAWSLLHTFESPRAPGERRGLGRFGRPLAFGVGILAGFWPQMLAWWILYGVPLYNPQKGEGSFSWLSPRLWEVLFSSNHGLILWTPGVALGILGLAWFARRDLPFAACGAIVFGLQLYTVASWSQWWQGSAFGGRMFTELLPVFALGLAALLSWLQRYLPWGLLWGCGVLLILWNLLLIFQYATGMLPPQGFVDWREVMVNQVSVAPGRFITVVTNALWERLTRTPALGLALILLVGLASFMATQELRSRAQAPLQRLSQADPGRHPEAPS